MAVEFAVQAGKLRQRVAIQEATETRDAIGGVVREWETLDTVWASVEPLTSREVIQASQVDNRTSHRIRLRHYSGLDSTMRFSFRGRVLNIVGVRNIDERGKVMICDVIEDATNHVPIGDLQLATEAGEMLTTEAGEPLDVEDA